MDNDNNELIAADNLIQKEDQISESSLTTELIENTTTFTVTNEKTNNKINNVTARKLEDKEEKQESANATINNEQNEIEIEDEEYVQSVRDKLLVFESDLQSIAGALAEKRLNQSGLSQLANYGSSGASSSEYETDDSDTESESSDESESEDEMAITDDAKYRVVAKNQSSSSSSSDSSSEEDIHEISSSSSSSSESDTESDKNKLIKNVDCKDKKKVKCDFDLSDLPPIENLQISVPESSCAELGYVSSIINELVVVEGNENMPPMDMDTVLFLNKGAETLGRIFDVFGPVNHPYYIVRFNSKEDILSKNIEVNTKVYCAPTTEHTNYVLVPVLMKMKGSDASWKNDQEPPSELLEYSDDEEERKSRLKRRNQRSTNDDATEAKVFHHKHPSTQYKQNNRPRNPFRSTNFTPNYQQQFYSHQTQLPFPPSQFFNPSNYFFNQQPVAYQSTYQSPPVSYNNYGAIDPPICTPSFTNLLPPPPPPTPSFDLNNQQKSNL